MKGAQNGAGFDGHKKGEGWLIVEQRVTDDGETRTYSWAHDDGRAEEAAELHRAWVRSSGDKRRRAHAALIREFPPTRWLSVEGGAGVRVDGHGEPIYVGLPAVLVAHVDVDEGYRVAPYEVTVRLERVVVDDSGRAVADDVRVRRRGDVPVTAAALRDVRLGELVDWMLTRAPVVESAGGDYLGPGHPAAAEVARTLGRKSGKRSGRVVTPEEVAEVARDAPPRQLVATLEEAFPWVGRRSLMRQLAEARALGLVEHRNRREV